MSRASTQVPLTGLFLAATHDPKTRLTSRGEHALIRPWLWCSFSMWDLTSGNSGKILIAIQRSSQKLWPLWTVTLAWRDQTSSSTSVDSTSTIRKRASGNSGKILIAIQRSDQKLWPVWTITLASRDQTSSSTSIDSTSTIWKRASWNSNKI